MTDCAANNAALKYAFSRAFVPPAGGWPQSIEAKIGAMMVEKYAPVSKKEAKRTRDYKDYYPIIIDLIGKSSDITSIEIARKLNVDPRRVYPVIGGLKKTGIITRFDEKDSPPKWRLI